MPTFRRKLWCWRWAPNRSSPHACESRQRCRGHERGAVVKTIGDAVMATFETPQLEGGRKLKMELVLGALVMIGIFVFGAMSRTHGIICSGGQRSEDARFSARSKIRLIVIGGMSILNF